MCNIKLYALKCNRIREQECGAMRPDTLRSKRGTLRCNRVPASRVTTVEWRDGENGLFSKPWNGWVGEQKGSAT